MNRITRKELKKDEFALEVSKTYDFIQEQRSLVIRYTVAAAVAVVLVAGGYWLFSHRKGQAQEQLAHATRVFFSEPGSTEPGMNFPDAKARYTQAGKEFATVADKYSWLHEAEVARYYQGLAQAELGRTDDAARNLKAVADKNDNKISPLARYALAGVYVRTGKLDDAEKLYRELAANPAPVVPKETAQLALADVLSTKNPAEALKVLEQVKKDAQGGAAGMVAERRLAELRTPK